MGARGGKRKTIYCIAIRGEETSYSIAIRIRDSIEASAQHRGWWVGEAVARVAVGEGAGAIVGASARVCVCARGCACARMCARVCQAA